MTQVMVRVPEEWVAVLDAIAAEREQSREAIMNCSIQIKRSTAKDLARIPRGNSYAS